MKEKADLCTIKDEQEGEEGVSSENAERDDKRVIVVSVFVALEQPRQQRHGDAQEQQHGANDHDGEIESLRACTQSRLCKDTPSIRDTRTMRAINKEAK